MAKFDLSFFKINQANLQIIYPNSFSLWDNSGKIWDKVKHKYPEMKSFEDPAPNKTTFNIDKNNLFSVAINNLTVGSVFPISNLDNFIEKCLFIYKICLDELHFNLIERLGFRLIYSKEYPSLDEITKLFLDLDLIKFPQKKLFNIDGKMTFYNFHFKWEGETLGCSTQLRAEKNNLILDPPLGWDLEVIKKEKYLAYYDVDYYTIGNINVNQLDLSTWLELAFRQIKKESETLFKVK
jgi:hypothetical protein